MKNELIEFFKNHPNPEDEDVHAWAAQKGYNKHEVEDKAYELATAYVQMLSKSKADKEGVTEKDVRPKELQMGLEVEKEHTPNASTRREIALDHLTEMPDYYSKLKAMEKKSSVYRRGYAAQLAKLGAPSLVHRAKTSPFDDNLMEEILMDSSEPVALAALSRLKGPSPLTDTQRSSLLVDMSQNVSPKVRNAVARHQNTPPLTRKRLLS